MRIPLNDTYHLRDYRDDDLSALVKYADNPKIAQFLRDRFPQPYERSDAVEWIRYVREHEKRTVLAIASDEELISNIGPTSRKTSTAARRSSAIGWPRTSGARASRRRR